MIPSLARPLAAAALLLLLSTSASAAAADGSAGSAGARTTAAAGGGSNKRCQTLPTSMTYSQDKAPRDISAVVSQDLPCHLLLLV